MAISLTTLSRLADEASFHAGAAKLLAPFAADASAQHLKNFWTVQRQIGALTQAAERLAVTPTPSDALAKLVESRM